MTFCGGVQPAWVNFAGCGHQRNKEPYFTLFPTSDSLLGLPTGWTQLESRRHVVVHGVSLLGQRADGEQIQKGSGGVWHKSIHYHFTIYMRARKDTQEEIAKKKYNYRRQAKRKAVWGTSGSFPLTTCSWLCMGEILRGFRMQGLETKTTFKIAAAVYFYLNNSTHIFQLVGGLAGWDIEGCRKLSKIHNIVVLLEYELTSTLETQRLLISWGEK